MQHNATPRRKKVYQAHRKGVFCDQLCVESYIWSCHMQRRAEVAKEKAMGFSVDGDGHARGRGTASQPWQAPVSVNHSEVTPFATNQFGHPQTLILIILGCQIWHPGARIHKFWHLSHFSTFSTTSNRLVCFHTKCAIRQLADQLILSLPSVVAQ